MRSLRYAGCYSWTSWQPWKGHYELVMRFVEGREVAETEDHVGERMSMALWWRLPVDLFVDLLPAVSPSFV